MTRALALVHRHVGSLITAALGLAIGVWVARAADLPRSDTVQLLLLSFGVAFIAYLIGITVMRRAQSPIIVAVIPLATVGMGLLAAANSMFVSSHDLSALGVVIAGAGTAGVLGARRLARELAEARTEADQAIARERMLEHSRRQLVAWVSHDLRTPLAGIQAMVEALDDGVVEHPRDVRDYYGRLTCETLRLSRLVDDLFELSRIESDGLDLTLERVSLGDVVSDAVASATVVAQARGVLLDGGIGHAEVEASSRELTRVVANLLDNAIRHTPPGGSVTVMVDQADSHAEVSVADTCGGIPAHDLDHVFDLAYRGDTARTPGAQGGAGLGLAIARGFVEAHRGDIAVRNDGDGCRFTVRLPLASSAPTS